MSPRREFNFWTDPEATHAVLHAHWPRIVDTPVDISIKTRLTKEMIAKIAKTNTPVAQYIAKYANSEYMWDELAAIAWLDPKIITRTEKLYLDASDRPRAKLWRYARLGAWGESGNRRAACDC